MARKTRDQLQAEAAALAAQSSEQLQDFLIDPMEAVRPYLDQAGVSDAETLFYVYRIVDDGKRPEAFLFKCKPEDFDPEDLAKQYGTDTYRMKVFIKDADHPNGVLRAAPKFAVERPPGYLPPKAPDTPAPPAAPAMDSQALVAAIVAAMAQVIPKQPPPPSRADMLAEMETMARIVAPKDTGTRGPDPWDLMSKAMDFTGKLRDAATPAGPIEGGATNNDLMLGVLREFGPMFKEVLARQPPGPVMQTVQAAPQPEQAQIAAPPAPSTLTPEQEEMNFRLKLGLQFLCTQAKADNDIGTYSDLVLDNVPEEELKMLMGAPDWLERLAAHHKDVLNYRPWFDKLRADIIEILNAPADDAAPQAPNTSDTDDPPAA